MNAIHRTSYEAIEHSNIKYTLIESEKNVYDASYMQFFTIYRKLTLSLLDLMHFIKK